MRIRQGSVAAGILLALLAVLAWRNVTDTDFGIHMAGGRWIAEQGAVPDTDPFTFTVSDHASVAYHWLFQLGLHAVDRVAGVRGLALLRAAMLLTTALLLLDVLRVRRTSALAGSLVGLCAILACEWRFSLRRAGSAGQRSSGSWSGDGTGAAAPSGCCRSSCSCG
jgi:hypothetical protein